MKRYFVHINLIIFTGILVSGNFVFAQQITPLPLPDQQTVSVTDLSTYVGDQIDNRLNQTDSGSGLSIYSSRTNAPWTRNVSSWTLKGSPIDFTGVAGSNDDLANHFNNGFMGGATLISPRHYVTAQHFKLANGTNVNFVDAGGNIITRKVVNSTNISGTDINIGILDADLPNTIKYYQLISASNLNSLVQKIDGQAIDLPVVVFNASAQTLVRSLERQDPVRLSHKLYTSGFRSSYSRDLAGGDSGQPVFLLIDNTPILLTANYHADDGPNLGNYISQINSAMSLLGGNFEINQYNPLSSFTKYIPATPTVPTVFTATPPSGCYSDQSQAKIVLNWNAPIAPYFTVDHYNLTINNGLPIYVPAGQLNWTHSSPNPKTTYNYSLKVVYTNGSVSSPKSIQATMTDLCQVNPIASVSPASQVQTAQNGSAGTSNDVAQNSTSKSTPSPAAKAVQNNQNNATTLNNSNVANQNVQNSKQVTSTNSGQNVQNNSSNVVTNNSSATNLNQNTNQSMQTLVTKFATNKSVQVASKKSQQYQSIVTNQTSGDFEPIDISEIKPTVIDFVRIMFSQVFVGINIVINGILGLVGLR